MSRNNDRFQMAQCPVCSSDLQVIVPQPKRYQNTHGEWFQRSDKTDGKVYCSETACRHYTVPLKLGNRPSRPVVA